MDGPSTPFESLIQGLLNRCTGGDAAELKEARQKMGKPEQKDIYWENCQSYGVNLSLGGCHLVDKESLANKSDGDNDHDDEAMMMMTAMVRKMMVMTSIEASFVSSKAAVGEIIIGTRLAHKFKQIFYHLDFLQICVHFDCCILARMVLMSLQIYVISLMFSICFLELTFGCFFLHFDSFAASGRFQLQKCFSKLKLPKYLSLHLNCLLS